MIAILAVAAGFCDAAPPPRPQTTQDAPTWLAGIGPGIGAGTGMLGQWSLFGARRMASGPWYALGRIQATGQTGLEATAMMGSDRPPAKRSIAGLLAGIGRRAPRALFAAGIGPAVGEWTRASYDERVYDYGTDRERLVYVPEESKDLLGISGDARFLWHGRFVGMGLGSWGFIGNDGSAFGLLVLLEAGRL